MTTMASAFAFAARHRETPKDSRAGRMFQAGFGLQAVATIMAMGSLLSAAALLALRLRATE